MQRKYFLLIFASVFIVGNISAALLSNVLPADRPYPIILILCDLPLIALAVVMQRRHLWTVAVTAFVLGQSGFGAKELFRPRQSGYFTCDGPATVVGVVSDIGVSSSGKPFAEIELEAERTILYAIPENISPAVGDTLTAEVLARRVADFTPGFDYVTHMARKGVFYTCIPLSSNRRIQENGPEPSITLRPCRHLPLHLLPAVLRCRLSRHIDTIFPENDQADVRALIKALAYGYQDEVSSDVTEAFRRSGAMHLLALSGMHLVLIYSILSSILSLFLRSPRALKIRSIALILILWSYTIFTGCGISILRAMIMITIYEAGALAGRSKHHLNSLALSAIIIAVADPYAPSGLSFQLSYSAMLAIFLIQPVVSGVIRLRSKLLRSFWEACTMAVSCSALTAPVIYLHFGTFAQFSLLVNILCSPITSLAMVLTPLSLLTQSVEWIPWDIIDRSLEWSVRLLVYINGIVASM